MGGVQQAGGAAAYLPVEDGWPDPTVSCGCRASIILLSSTVNQNLATDQRLPLQPDSQYIHIQVTDQKLVPIDGMVELFFEASG